MADAASFDEFYLGARDRLALQVAALTGDAAEAPDHVQEAFVRAWQRWETVGRYDDPEGWVRRVAYNLAVSRWRRARRIVLRTAPAAAAPAFDGEQRDLLEALRALGVHEREAIVLHHLVGYCVDDVAAQLGAPSGTVKSWLARGRARLAVLLGEEVGSNDAR